MRSLGLDEVMRVGPLDRISVLIRGRDQSLCALSPHSEKVDKPGRRFSPGTNLVAPSSWISQPPETRNKYLLFKPLSLWYFVITTQAKTLGLRKETLCSLRTHLFFFFFKEHIFLIANRKAPNVSPHKSLPRGADEMPTFHVDPASLDQQECSDSKQLPSLF